MQKIKSQFKNSLYAIKLVMLSILGCSTTNLQQRVLGQAGNTSTEHYEKMFSIPVTEIDGNIRLIQTRVCFPRANKKAPLVILNHGSPHSIADRRNVSGYTCNSEPVQWFLSRGYLVASPIRRGYGITGGVWSEKYGPCDQPDYINAGLETARDIQAAVNFLTKIPESQSEHVVIIGQSAGGWGTIAYSSLPHNNVSALINMAGGRGGHKNQIKNQNCSPDSLIRAAGQFGKSEHTNMLWIYAANDSFFDPALAKSMYEAFINSGGKAEFIQEPAFSNDGHSEFGAIGGSKIWGPAVEKYLNQQLKL